jgi:hypothetical protein
MERTRQASSSPHGHPTRYDNGRRIRKKIVHRKKGKKKPKKNTQFQTGGSNPVSFRRPHAETGYLPNSGNFMKEFEVSRRTVTRIWTFFPTKSALRWNMTLPETGSGYPTLWCSLRKDHSTNMLITRTSYNSLCAKPLVANSSISGPFRISPSSNYLKNRMSPDSR